MRPDCRNDDIAPFAVPTLKPISRMFFFEANPFFLIKLINASYVDVIRGFLTMDYSCQISSLSSLSKSSCSSLNPSHNPPASNPSNGQGHGGRQQQYLAISSTKTWYSGVS